MTLCRRGIPALSILAVLLPVGVLKAQREDPRGVFDVIVSRVSFDRLSVKTSLEFCWKKMEELDPDDAKGMVFVYDFSEKTAQVPITCELQNVTLMDLLLKICKPAGIVIDVKPGKVIFSDGKTGESRN